MKGAKALLGALRGHGVEVCFANPGTSEMHFVASLDAVGEIRAVLGLFEGVVHRGRRRLRPDGGRAGGDAVAPRARVSRTGWPTSTTHEAGRLAGRQHRR